MKRFAAPFAAVPLLCSFLAGQSSVVGNQPPTFHVQGTIKDPTGAVIPEAEVTFHAGQVITNIASDRSGHYEADLPLGLYTINVRVPRFHEGRRLFRVAPPESIFLNATLQVAASCDPAIVNSTGRPPTPHGYKDAEEQLCHYGFESLPAASEDGAPFYFGFHCSEHAVSGHVSTYHGRSAMGKGFGYGIGRGLNDNVPVLSSMASVRFRRIKLSTTLSRKQSKQWAM